MGYRPRGRMPKVIHPPQGGSGLRLAGVRDRYTITERPPDPPPMRPSVTRVPISPSPTGQRSPLPPYDPRFTDVLGKPPPTLAPSNGDPVYPEQLKRERRSARRAQAIRALFQRLFRLFIRPRSQLPEHIPGSRVGRW